MQRRNMKRLLFALLALLTAAFAAGCGEETEEPHINIGDMESGAGITSAADLAAFFESGGESSHGKRNTED